MNTTISKSELTEKQQASVIRLMINILSGQVHIKQPTAVVRSISLFLGLKPPATFKGSRIVRRYNKSFEEFIFKGYDQQKPGLSRPGSFKTLKMVCKN